MALLRASFASVIILCVACLSSAGVIADLSQNFSTPNNPNTGAYGTWSYNSGTVPLTFQNILAGGSNTPGYGTPLNQSGDFLPLVFQIPSNGLSGLDALPGDIVVHTTDQANGINPNTEQENGPANITWTSPVAGTVTVSGILWSPALLPPRLNDYEIILDPGASQTILGSGNIPEDGSNSRANPIPFSFSNVSLSDGSVIELLFTQDRSSQYGFYVGADLTITSGLGDFNDDGHVDAADILPMMQALTNLSGYKTKYDPNLTNGQLLVFGDINHDGTFNNADLQALLNLLKSGHGSTNPVPEPSTIVLAVLAFVLALHKKP
jgi:hypothetical protein